MKFIPALIVVLTISLTGVGFAADIGTLAWDQANIDTLRSFDKDAVATFLNEQRRKEGLPPGIPFVPITAREIVGWANPAGNGQYQLLVASSGPCASAVTVYNRDPSGTLATVQVIQNFADLKRDLNRDGKDELIIREPLVEHSCINVIAWPAVYRFENGKYVEASRDFPGFYDKEVLPHLATLIAKYQGKASDLTEDLGAGPIMERDKILRVLGRDPTAGLDQAYKWMKTDDPLLLLDAEATFKDIGGHPDEANAAEASYKRATCQRHPTFAMCRNVAQH